MKSFALGLGLVILCHVSALAQEKPKRQIRFRPIGKDSVNLSFNQDYYLIEDSCAQIVRQAHYNFKEKKYFGAFKDVSAADPSVVLAEGTYTADGLKQGPFIARHVDGSLQAKGTYEQNKPTGTWELFYPSGTKKLVFEAQPEGIKILDFWTPEGKQTVTAGKGTYTTNTGAVVWTGKLLNGQPDGSWKASRVNDRSNAVLLTEDFKNGQLKGGRGPIGAYTDASRIVLLPDQLFPYLTAETLRASAVPCNGTARQRIQGAQYRYGAREFSEKIKQLVGPYLGGVDLKSYDDELELEGVISTVGRIGKLNYKNAFDYNIAMGLVRELQKLPNLEPALIDGKPVTQKIIISFKFTNGWYSFSYRFLPVETQQTAKGG